MLVLEIQSYLSESIFELVIEVAAFLIPCNDRVTGTRCKSW